MNFLELSRKIDEAVITKDLEKVLKFIKSNSKKRNQDELKSLINKEFPKLDDEDIQLAIELS